MKIIDVHLHSFGYRYKDVLEDAKRSGIDPSPAGLKREMRKNGIEKAVTITSDDEPVPLKASVLRDHLSENKKLIAV